MSRRPTSGALMLCAVVVFLAALVAVGVRGASDVPDRSTQAQRIAAGLRCPVCRDLSAADSPAPLARQMRRQISADLAAGRSADQIRARFVAAYGPSVLLSPPGEGVGRIVRALPFAVPAVGLAVGIVLLRRWRRRDSSSEPAGDLAARPARPAVPPSRTTRRSAVVIVGTAVAAVVAVSATLVDAVAPSTSSPAASAAVADSDRSASVLDHAVRRVKRHPRSVHAHLALARAYTEAGDQRLAAIEYIAVVEVEPANAEANTALAGLAFAAGASKEAKRIVDRVLRIHPDYPEALYTRALVELMGLHQRAAGLADLKAYRAAAPYGAHRDAVATLLAMFDRSSPSTSETRPGS